MDYASKLTARRFYLSRIPKERILIDERTGEEYVEYLDLTERREVGKYGETHYASIYDKEKGTIYLGNFKPKTSRSAAQAPSAVPTLGDDPDMPF